MSESIDFTAGSVTIYGTLEGARLYLGMEHDEWDVADDSEVTTDMKRALVKARRFLDRLEWAEDYETFEERDAIEAFHQGAYELAALLGEDPDALGFGSTGSLAGVTSISAGGDSISLAPGIETEAIPGLAWLLLSEYLATGEVAPIEAEVSGQHGGTVNPFALSPEFWTEDI